MLSERKRFNYNVGTNQSIRSRSKNKPIVSSISTPLTHACHDQNLRSSKVVQVKDSSKRVQQLEALNKKLVEETTQQFKRLQSDVQRVQKILQEKQGYISQLQQQSNDMHTRLEKASEEKKLLIEAILEKDLVIHQYQHKLKQLLEKNTEEPAPIEATQVELQEGEVQTDCLPETCPKSELKKVERVNSELSDELYEVRQELFDAQNKLKLITQQFEAFKVLKQIQSIQQI